VIIIGILASKEINQSNARFDSRLPKEQKVFFERAAAARD
jgi:hypothetical protein